MRLIAYLTAALLGVAATGNAQNTTLDLKEASSQAGESIAEFNQPARVTVFGQVRVEGMQYLSVIPESPELTYSQLLSARLSVLKETPWFDAAADISGGTFFTLNQSHFVVHEAYFSTNNKGIAKAYLGRKKMAWSDLDHRWQLGLWQPKFAIDTLRPDEQGLTGLFLDLNGVDAQFVAFATPLFIPSMGPDIREESGGLVAKSRWYQAPARNYEFNNRINAIRYELSIPETAKLVLNSGISVMGRIGAKEAGPWFVTSAGHLPVNDLLLKRKNFKDVAADKVDVKVTPDITYHSVYAIDMGYTFSNIKTSLSYLQDEPREKLPEVDWATQKLNPIRAISTSLDFTTEKLLNRSLAFQMEYLKVYGGGISDVMADGTPDDITLYDQRLNFTNALSFRVEGQLASLFQRPLVTRFKYLYEYDQKGALINTEFLYYPSQKWAVIMGGDILGVEDEKQSGSRFLNQYRANDRFYGGMTYVF